MSSRPLKKRKLTPPTSDDEGRSSSSKPNEAKLQKEFFKNAASWKLEHLEKDYELRRKKKKKEKESSRLPIKTPDGRIQQQVEVRAADAVSVASDADWLESDGDEGGDVQDTVEDEPEPEIPEREQILRAREELARLASQLNENPEEHPGAFKSLADVFRKSALPAVQKLCLVTQMAVYKDVIPGYRIRPPSEETMGEKVSKEVRRLRTYETALVSGYQGYVKTLAQVAATRTPRSFRTHKAGQQQQQQQQDLPSIAITCACTLLNAVPHFNFRSDLLKILVRKLSGRRPDAAAAQCRRALETLFREDDEGRPSMEAVSVLTKMMKAREYRIDQSVLNLFLHLRLLSEFSGKASQNSITRATADDDTGNGRKQRKQEKQFRTKRERKLLKEQKAAEKVMAQADASVSHEEREQMQSETLKMVFATYFRILKLRSPHLMGAVLEGLAKYAHLINQDFFGDLLEALKDLIRESENGRDGGEDEGEGEGEVDIEDDDDDEPAEVVRDTSREALLCTVTAYALLAGQDAHDARSQLHLDLSFFTTHVYRSLLPLSVNPDIELGAQSLHLPDPDAAHDPRATGGRHNQVNLQTTTVLLMRCLQGILLPPWNIRSVPPLRLAAFAKQLMSAALHLPEKSAQAVLALVQDVVHTHGKKVGALWRTEERKGDGAFNPLSESVEGSNPFATTVWEGELLRHHYCPKVREAVVLLEKSLASI